MNEPYSSKLQPPLHTYDDDMTQDESIQDDVDWGDDASTFGDRLARAREAAGMSQAQLARRLGVKVSTMRNWEADRSEPRANRLSMLSGLLNVSIIWLMSGEGEGVPEHADADLPQIGDLKSVLAELRALKVAQAQLAERAGKIEKSLRLLAAQTG